MRTWWWLAIAGCTSAPDGVVINEVMSANDSAVRDPSQPECAEFDDWIELYNAGDESVDLADLHVEDSADRLDLTGVLAPGEHVVIWADNQLDQDGLHAPFRVSAEGETLSLWSQSERLDEVEVPMFSRDHSWARVRDGDADFVEVLTPTPGRANHRLLPDDPCFEPPRGFDDHSFACISTDEGYLGLAGDRSELAIVKFDIFDFQDDSNRRVAFVDSEFYTLHDQYYLFRVMNGQTFGGLDEYAPYGRGDFRTWAELESWARSFDLSTEFPAEQIRFIGQRLYSSYFYSAINGENRDLGVGTIVHRPATATREAFWGFELEFGDSIEYEDLVVYFETLEEFGPPAFREIRWLIRSTPQEELAAQMEEDGLPYADRLTRYDELAEPGATEVYNPGLAAGRVVRIRAGEDGLENTRSTDILLLEEIPDYLPPAAGLITSVPQTPLSHISLLARSRGIPNMFVSGVTNDPQWDAWSRVSVRVALEATADGQVRANLMTTADYIQWQALNQRSAPMLESVDPAGMPLLFDLEVAPPMLELRPVVGGKAAGMRQLLLEPTLDPPNRPLGITIRPYLEHVDGIDGLAEMLEASPFTSGGSAPERVLVLEGREVYDERFPSSTDAEVREGFFVRHPPETLSGALARGDGLVGLVRSRPLSDEVRSELRTSLTAAYGNLPADQGIRFRSSSTIEDVEGFNGAGLYVSSTGYLSPAEGQRSVDDAIRTVWASYWGTEAFEERRSAGIDPLAGGMGVLVHPRFDDLFESSNAVLTTSVLPDGTHEMLLNVQDGNISVANPPTTCPPVLPEIVRVRDASGVPVVERLGTSTEVPDDEAVLNDDQVLALFNTSVAATESWLATENAEVEPSKHRSVLTLDLEAREMASGWLGSVGDRLVLKQARSLEPSLGALPLVLRELSAPRDVLARAKSIAQITCSADEAVLTAFLVQTDPSLQPDVGYATEPLLVSIQLDALTAIPELGWIAGQTEQFDHTEFASFFTSDANLSASLDSGSILVADGTISISLGDDMASIDGTCERQTLWASPNDFLLELLDQD